ncbi:MAG: ABC transporter substrate-binding protein, partial [Betaproteobacteria bacterium]
MKITTLILIALTSLLTGCGETKKEIVIGYIEGLSGPFANVGEMGLRHLELEVDAVNERGELPEGMRLKVAPFDNKTNPQEALLAFRSALDAGVDYVFQGNSSSVALALSDAIGKHNQRNPDRQVLFLNYAAVDPALTNDRCDKSHFRFDADVDMKISALTDYMASREDIKSVYLINQDYSFGQAVSKA